ncbi:MAG: NAAT family transporter [Chlamydiae bacterium]|nr:NAAT family transporter [Chlamydiota bacterium]
MDTAIFSTFSIAFSLFLLMDPIGNIPLYLVILKHTHPSRQRKIIFREALIALVIIILFAFLGNGLMSILHISHETIYISGGIVLFLLAVQMVFPGKGGLQESLMTSHEEPLIFPLAVPLLAGPSALAAVMIFARQSSPIMDLIIAILLAWAASTLILLASPWIAKIFGERGLKALERLMGLILILISLQMFLEGVTIYLET